VKDTKTFETRTVDLTDDLVHHLRRHLAWLAGETLRRGWGEARWLFPNEAGQPLDEARTRKVFQRALKRAKLPAFRVYDLRHTFASLLLASCADYPMSARSSATPTRRPRSATTLIGFRTAGIGGRRTRQRAGSDEVWHQILAPKRNRGARWCGTPRLDWWAVKDSNLGPAD
jgi:hypothetical protein